MPVKFSTILFYKQSYTYYQKDIQMSYNSFSSNKICPLSAIFSRNEKKAKIQNSVNKEEEE